MLHRFPHQREIALYSVWLPLTRELSAQLTEGEKIPVSRFAAAICPLMLINVAFMQTGQKNLHKPGQRECYMECYTSVTGPKKACIKEKGVVLCHCN